MSDVRVTDLRRRLGHHLRNVQGGEPITVLHRSTPIARIIPYEEEGASLTVRHPLPGVLSLKQISLPPPLRLRRDLVALLLEERQGER
jgi:prevent-host-death family protein